MKTRLIVIYPHPMLHFAPKVVEWDTRQREILQPIVSFLNSSGKFSTEDVLSLLIIFDSRELI